MPLRFSLPHALAVAASAALLVPGAAASAREGEGGWHNGSWYGEGDAPPPPAPGDRGEPGPPPPPRHEAPPYEAPRDDQAYARPQYDPAGRDAWLADCRSRVSARDNGVGGAVIGGVVGGVAGNRIAGRHHRTVGTVAGAAVGAVAGAAIDRAEDRGRADDECQAYLDDYYARYTAGYQQGYAQPGYAYAPAYGYPAGGCCVSAPVMMVPVRAEPECTETVEYIYEDVPVRHRPVRTKRVRVVPDKRVKIVPDKRVNIK